jgi:hypothetical protein
MSWFDRDGRPLLDARTGRLTREDAAAIATRTGILERHRVPFATERRDDAVVPSRSRLCEWRADVERSA